MYYHLLFLVRSAGVIADFLIDFAIIPGTNLLGLALAAGAILSLAAAADRLGAGPAGQEAAVMLGGAVCFLADSGIRRLAANRLRRPAPAVPLEKEPASDPDRQATWEAERGGKLIFIPLWIFGLLWVVSGLCRLAWVLTR